MVIGIYSNDLYNKENRNESTAWTDEYNCAGYALGTFNWLLPYDEEDREIIKENDFNFDLLEETTNTQVYTVENFTKYLLKTFNNLRVIEYPSQAKDNEEVIGMRIDYNDLDFHFIRRKLNKKWYHKIGGCEVTRFNEENVFKPLWCNRYNSEIVFFAKRVGKKKRYEDVIKGKETFDTVRFL